MDRKNEKKISQRRRIIMYLSPLSKWNLKFDNDGLK